MNPSRNTRISKDTLLSKNTRFGALTVVAVALVVAGGAFAAGKHHGSKASAATGLTVGSFVASSTSTTTHDGGPGHGPSDELAAAATYLGLSQADLQTALQSGKTLAQVADATTSKSTAGLIDALVAAEQTEIAAAVTAGELTQAQSDQITPTLKARFTDLANGVRPERGPGFGHGFGHGGPGGGELAAAATYLGLTQTNLETALQSGKTLSQVADATTNKSTAGLIDALVAAEKTELAAAITAGKLTQAQSDQMTTNLKARFTDLVNGVHPAHADGGPDGDHGDHRDHGGFGAPPASGSSSAPTTGTHI
jgi:F0F1-type ATP synthase delta subunit